MNYLERQGLHLLREYDKFVCKAVYSKTDIVEFMVYNDFILKMFHEGKDMLFELLKGSDLSDDEMLMIMDYCVGVKKLCAAKECITKFFDILTYTPEMLNILLSFKQDNDVCLLMLKSLPKTVKSRLVENDVTTATKLMKYLVFNKKKPYGISPKMMHFVFGEIKKVDAGYDVEYLKQVYTMLKERETKSLDGMKIDFYKGLTPDDLFMLYSVSVEVDQYNLNQAIALVHAYRRFIETDLAEMLINCFGDIVPEDVREFTKNMDIIDEYIIHKKGMRLSEFEDIAIRSAYYLSRIAKKKVIRELLNETDYGRTLLMLDILSKEERDMLSSKIGGNTVRHLQNYIVDTCKIPVDINYSQFMRLYGDFESKDYHRYKRWVDTFIVKKGDYPLYILS